MGNHSGFFYGTLMAPEILHRVIYGSSILTSTTKPLASSLQISPALLHGYCRHKVLHCDYPGIIPQEGHSVRGTFVTGLRDEDIESLDVFEGSEYERRVVKVALIGEGEGNGKEQEAEVYVFTAGEERLEKKECDFEEFRREKMFRWTDSSWEYKEVDDAFHGNDPTGGRSIANGTGNGNGHVEVNSADEEKK